MPHFPLYLCECERRWLHVLRRLTWRCRYRYNDSVSIEVETVEDSR